MSEGRSTNGGASDRFFDDFRVGERFDAGTRTVEQEDLDQFTVISGDAHPIHWDAEYCRDTPFGRPILHGPFGIALAFGQLHALGVFDASVIAMRSVSWEFLRPMFVGDEISVDMTITRCRVGRGGTTGTVHRWLRLVNQDGVVVQSGMSPAVLHRRQGALAESVHGLDFASVPWAELVASRLRDDALFRESCATFDGAIGFAAGDDEVYFRVFHGDVLECTRRSDAARRFVVAGTEPEWVDFVFAARNDYLARATRGQFDVHGDVFEYLRLTKAVHRCWEAIRALAQETARSHAG